MKAFEEKPKEPSSDPLEILRPRPSLLSRRKSRTLRAAQSKLPCAAGYRIAKQMTITVDARITLTQPTARIKIQVTTLMFATLTSASLQPLIRWTTAWHSLMRNLQGVEKVILIATALLGQTKKLIPPLAISEIAYTLFQCSITFTLVVIPRTSLEHPCVAASTKCLLSPELTAHKQTWTRLIPSSLPTEFSPHLSRTSR